MLCSHRQQCTFYFYFPFFSFNCCRFPIVFCLSLLHVRWCRCVSVSVRFSRLRIFVALFWCALLNGFHNTFGLSLLFFLWFSLGVFADSSLVSYDCVVYFFFVYSFFVRFVPYFDSFPLFLPPLSDPVLCSHYRLLISNCMFYPVGPSKSRRNEIKDMFSKSYYIKL